MTSAQGDTPQPLFSYAFVVLTLAAGFGFCNIAVFYDISVWLERLGVPESLRGLVIAAEPLAALALRPFLGLWITPGVALRVAAVSLAGMGLALVSYQAAHSLPLLLAVRLAHGVSFVCLVSAIMSLFAQVVPRQRSGQAFAVFSLASQIPFAVMPLAAGWMLSVLGSQDLVYAWCAVLVLPGLVLLAPLGSRLAKGGSAGGPAPARPSLAQVRAGLACGRVAYVLAANFLVFCGTTIVFYNMLPFGAQAGAANPQLFFTVFTAVSLAVRLVGNALFDKLPKLATLAVALAALAGAMALFAPAGAGVWRLPLAGLYGVALGFAVPLLNAVVFSATPANLRGVNLNLMLFTMDAGYVIGPSVGGVMLGFGLGYGALFGLCAALALAACALAVFLARDAHRQRGLQQGGQSSDGDS